MLLCFEAGGRRRGSPRTRSVARWGLSFVILTLCSAVYVMYPRTFYPRGRGLYLRLPMRDVYES